MPMKLDDALIGWPEAQAELEALRTKLAEVEANNAVLVSRINRDAREIADLEAAHQQIMGVCDPNTVPYQIARKALKG